MSYPWPRGRRRPAPPLPVLAVLALATLALVAGPTPAVASPPARAAVSGRSAVALRPPEAVVLVGRVTWDQAAVVARRHGGPLTAGLLATLPGEAPLRDRVLTMAAAKRVRGADADQLDRFRAATPEGCYRRLPPVQVVAAAGMEDAGLLAVRERGTPPPAQALPPSGPLTPTAGRLLVVAVPDSRALEDALGRLPPGAQVLVAGLQPAPGRARTTPLLDLGGPRGVATSVSTRRDGLVALVDLCPTLVGAAELGDGTAIRAVAAADPVAVVTRLDGRVAALVVARTWAIPLLVLAAVIAAAAVGRAWRFGPGDRAAPAARALRGALLLTLALPSGYLVASRVAPSSAVAWLALGVAAGALLAAGAAAVGPPAAAEPGPVATGSGAGERPWWRSGPVVLGVVLLALVVADLASGGHGLERPLLGGSAYDGERFYGLGNGYFAMALAAIMLVAAFTGLPAVGVAAMLGGLALVDGLPMLGADVGGALTASLTAGLALLLLGRRRSLAATLLLLGLAAAGGLVLVSVAAMIADPSTHGSRFLTTLLDEGPAAAGRIVTHQLGRNFALLRGSPVAWVGPLEVLAAALLAWRPPAFLDALAGPLGRPASASQPLSGAARTRRVVLLGALGSTLLVLLNDTGVTAIASSGLFLLAILAWSAFAQQPASGPPPQRDAAGGAEVGGRPARTGDR
ncbi:MAG TPA: hypothetical protein VF486_00595 [Actinomycetes bacterium]